MQNQRLFLFFWIAIFTAPCMYGMMEENESREEFKDVVVVWYPSNGRLGHMTLAWDGEVQTNEKARFLRKSEKFLDALSKKVDIESLNNQDHEVILEIINSDTLKRTKLSDMIDKAKYPSGDPFFCFILKASQHQLRKLKNSKLLDRLDLCTGQTLNPLDDAGITTVPLPIKLSPLSSALFLACSKVTGRNNVKKIKYFGSESKAMDCMKMGPGLLSECTAIVLVPLFTLYLSYISYIVATSN